MRERVSETEASGLDTDRLRRLVFVWSMVLVLQEKYSVSGESAERCPRS